MAKGPMGSPLGTDVSHRRPPNTPGTGYLHPGSWLACCGRTGRAGRFGQVQFWAAGSSPWGAGRSYAGCTGPRNCRSGLSRAGGLSRRRCAGGRRFGGDGWEPQIRGCLPGDPAAAGDGGRGVDRLEVFAALVGRAAAVPSWASVGYRSRRPGFGASPNTAGGRVPGETNRRASASGPDRSSVTRRPTLGDRTSGKQIRGLRGNQPAAHRRRPRREMAYHQIWT